jgi:hypothetical protein
MHISAILCDYAQVAGGKLFISGAGITLLGTPVVAPPHTVQISLALLVTIPWNATNQPHRLTVELISDADGKTERVPLTDAMLPGQDPNDAGMIVAEFNAGRAPQMHPGDDSLMPIALPMGLPLPRQGDYFFVIRVDGTEAARASFRLSVSQPGMNLGMGSPLGW